MTRRNKNTNTNNKPTKRQIPNTIAYPVVVLAGCAFVYFTFFNDTSISTTFKRPISNAVQSVQTTGGNAGKTVINNVEAPDSANAPQLMIPSINNLGIYRSEQIQNNILLTSENQKVELEEARLKLDTAKYKRKTIKDSSADSDFGISTSAPVHVTNTQPPLLEADQPDSYENGITENGQISLISISKINDQLEAMITYNGQVVSVNLQGIVYSSSKDIPNLAVTQLDDQSLCVEQNSKNQCFKVY